MRLQHAAIIANTLFSCSFGALKPGHFGRMFRLADTTLFFAALPRLLLWLGRSVDSDAYCVGEG
jgi:hypothetical protein